jgi:hypothetical protein
MMFIEWKQRNGLHTSIKGEGEFKVTLSAAIIYIIKS